MIKAVIFDVGGVLVRTPDRSSRLVWEKRLGLADWESEEIVFTGEIGTQAQKGMLTDSELWAWVRQRLALSQKQLADFRRDFWAGDRLDFELIEYIRRLRSRYQTAIISNATDALRSELQHKYPIADAFDLIVVSAEEGIMKPNLEIYLRALTRLERSAGETVFVDDNSDNVQAARSLGIRSLNYNTGMDVPKELEKLGVTIR